MLLEGKSIGRGSDTRRYDESIQSYTIQRKGKTVMGWETDEGKAHDRA